MSLHYADNAVMAKVRALYGKRLKAADYDQLLAKKSVGEVAGYLKKETYYAENLAEVKEDLIHREQLEVFVRRRVLDTYVRLLKYSRGDNFFLTLYIMDHEVEQLLTAIRLLNSGSINRYIISLPVHLARLLSFDLFAIAGIDSFDGLLALLEHSDYYRILGRFRPATSGRNIDITACEAALITHYCEKALTIIRREYSGDTRDDLERIIRLRASLHNLSVIFRMRRYLNAGRDMTERRLAAVDGDPCRGLYARLLDAPDLRAMQEIFSHSRVFRNHPLDWTGDSRRIATQLYHIRRGLCRRVYRFTGKPVVAVISYMALLEIEVRNIIHIIEGIRYGLPPPEIRQLLTV